MARLTRSEPYMQAIEDLIAHDPSLEETLAIMLDKEALTTIGQSRQKIAKGTKFLSTKQSHHLHDLCRPCAKMR